MDVVWVEFLRVFGFGLGECLLVCLLGLVLRFVGGFWVLFVGVVGCGFCCWLFTVGLVVLVDDVLFIFLYVDGYYMMFVVWVLFCYWFGL